MMLKRWGLDLPGHDLINRAEPFPLVQVLSSLWKCLSCRIGERVIEIARYNKFLCLKVFT
jgi:hypothetical protein